MFKIMIVEDDEKIRKIISETLRKWQYFHKLMNINPTYETNKKTALILGLFSLSFKQDKHHAFS
ncbi:hypothetical protein [Gottfriedia acidiceleris]|uniref:hypothetical protein n=1 Tax=Gottfriedia acidiceleris TaxID=371036 RepID=UPI002FFEA189